MSNLKKLRRWLFAKKHVQSEKLLPTQYALHQAILTADYPHIEHRTMTLMQTRKCHHYMIMIRN